MNESTSKPSGLRPPSKIGRPCFGTTPKPAVPQTPKSNGTSSSVRKLTEDLLRTRINDNSVILTEDTDSFIVGDKVWVGGSKPGRIAFIGETHFASGDWAGIVLDEPVGKNDGSVGGTRYFQCEPKKGVFSRLGRLSRFPINMPSPPMGPSPSPPPCVTPTSKRATPPPIPRTPPLVSPPSPAPSTKGEPVVGDRVIVMSGQGSKIGNLRYIGETEFSPGLWCGVELDDPIGKNDGSVQGIRYFECLPKYGIFVPAAKVSKSPAPDRRPSCQIHHSVRRASSRESLTSVTSRASTVASTASRVRLGINSLKKPMPRPSTTVLGTPRATPQELLKSKQEQIEKLLKDRDLDRARMVKAAEQTEEAEKQLNLLKAEFELFRVESQKKTQELEVEIKKVHQEKSDLVTQLEDWKFRAEEEAIFKSTLEEEQQEQQQCMDAWKKSLSDKEEEIKNLKIQISELSDAREEIDHLKKDLETLKKLSTENENELKKELIDTIDRANRMEQNYNDVQNEFENQSSLKVEVGPLKENISKLEASLSESQMKCADLEKACKEACENIEKEKFLSQDMKQKLTLLENKLKDAEEFNKLLGEEDKELKSKCEELSKLSSQVIVLQDELSKAQTNFRESNEQNELLKKNLEQLESDKTSMKEELLGLQKSLDEWKSSLAQKEGEIKALFLQVSELNETKLLMSSLKEETESFRKKASEIENELKKELIETVERANRMEEKFNETQEKFQFREEEMSAEVASLKDTINNLEASLVESGKLSNTLEARSLEAESKVREKEEVIENIRKEAHQLEYKLKEAETYNKLLGEGEQKLKSQCAEMSNLLTQVTQLKEDLNDIQKKYKSALDQNESLLKELDEIQASSNNKLIDIDRKYNNDIQNLKKKLEEFSSELSNKEKELSEEKIKTDEHEREFSCLQKELVDLKGCLEVNKNNLNERETEISLLKKDLEETKGQLANSLESFERLKTEDAKAITDLSDELNRMKISIADLLNEQNNLISSFENEKKTLTEKVTQLESLNLTLETEINSLKNEVNLKVNDLISLQAQYTELYELSNKEKSELESKVSHIAKLESQITDFEKKRDNLVLENEDLKHSLEEKVKSFNELKGQLEKILCDLEVEKNGLTNEISELKHYLTEVERERNELVKSDRNLKESLNIKEDEIKQLLLELGELNKSINYYANLENEFKLYKDEQSKAKKFLRNELEATLERECLLKKSIDDTKTQLLLLEKRNYEEILCLKEKNSEFQHMLSESEKNKVNLQINLDSSGLIVKEQEAVIQQLNEKLKYLEYKIQEAETYNKLLGEEEQELKKQYANLSNLMTQVSQLEEELTAVKDNNKFFLNENNELKKDLGELQSLKSELLSEKEGLELSIEAWKKHGSDKETELKASNNIIDSLNKELILMKNEFSQVKNDLQTDLTVANNENKVLQENLDCLKNIMEIERMQAKDEKNQLSEKISTLGSSLSKLKDLNTEIVQNLEIAETKIHELENLIDYQKNIIMNLQNTLKLTEENSCAEKQQLVDNCIEINNLTIKLKSVEEELTTLKDNNQKLSKQRDELMHSLFELETSSSSNKIENEKLVLSLNETKTLLSEKIQEVTSMSKRIDELIELNNSLSHTTIDLNDLKKSSSELEQKLKIELKREMDRSNMLERRLNDARHNFDLLKSENDSEIEVLKKSIAKLESSESQMIDLNSKLSKEIENLYMKIKELSLEVGKMNKELLDEKLKSDKFEKECMFLQTSLNHSISNMNEKEKHDLMLRDELEKSKKELKAYEIHIEEERLHMSEKINSLENELKLANDGFVLVESEKNKIISSKDEMNEMLKKNISSLKCSVSDLVIEVENYKFSENSKAKELLLLQNRYTEDVANLRSELEVKSLEIDRCSSTIRELSKKNQELLEKESELEELKKTSLAISSEKENVHEELALSKKNLLEVTTKLTKTEKDASEKERLFTSEIDNMKEQYEKLKSEFKMISEASSKTNDELESKCQNMLKELEETQKLSQLKEDNVSEKLKKVEEENKTLIAQVNERRESEKQLGEIVENLNSQLEKEKSSNAKFTNDFECIRKDTQNKIDVLEAQVNVLKREKELLEDKAKQLSSEVSSLKVAKNTSHGTEDSGMAAWLEEKELAESEISFLNSIIVDMKKKNDILNERIQAMEMGETSLEMNGMKKKKKAVTPRMFCDICDVFDAHETEDCPRQASADSPPPVQSHAPLPRGTVRPYCDVCEIFGHSTEECDDSQTF